MLGGPPGLDGGDVEEAEAAADAALEGGLGLLHHIKGGIFLDGFEEDGIGGGILAAFEKPGGAEACFPGLLVILEDLGELLGLEVGFGADVGIFEEFANGEGVVGVDPRVVLEVVADAVELGLGTVVEAGHVGIEHGFDEGLKGLALAGGDGFVGVGGEAVALLDEDELFACGGQVGLHGGHAAGAGIIDGGAGADGAGGGVAHEGDDALVGLLELLLGAGLLGAGTVELGLELIDLGSGTGEGGEGLLKGEIGLWIDGGGGRSAAAELGLDFLFEEHPATDGHESELNQHEDDDAGDKLGVGLAAFHGGAGVMGRAGDDRFAGRVV